MIHAELIITESLWHLSLGYAIGHVAGQAFFVWVQRRKGLQ